ncbi:MAG: type II toxin-antitoxin system VapC family toxin [Planctomycetota bacterium]
MPAGVYIETSIPNALVSQRTDAASIYHGEITDLWWNQQRRFYDVWISEAVVAELEQGNWPGQREALDVVRPLPRLAIDEEILNVARRYVWEHLVPKSLGGDATHLAVACVHQVDFLLTWNIRHLANSNKLQHLLTINRRMGLPTPYNLTPDALWMEE